MKYKLTWKDIILTNLKMFIFLGFPIFLVFVLCITFLIHFFNGELGEYGIGVYLKAITDIFPTLLVIYACVVFFVFATSFRYWKDNIVGEHELVMDEEFFIWKSARQEVKTKLSLFKDFTVKRKSIIIKFDGIKKAKIEKNWILEGYDEFVAHMTQILSQKK